MTAEQKQRALTSWPQRWDVFITWLNAHETPVNDLPRDHERGQ